MTPAEVTKILRKFARASRADEYLWGTSIPGVPTESGAAVESAIEMIERLEAAEKGRDWHAERCEDAMNECAALRAKIEAAERSDAESVAMYRKARDERDALRVENEALAANLRGKHSTAGATYAHLIAERDALRAAVRHEADCVEACKSEIDAMRAKVERMERQGPVEWQTRTRPAWNDGTWGPWRKCSEEYAEDIKKTPLLHDWLYEARALYALPGAKGE